MHSTLAAGKQQGTWSPPSGSCRVVEWQDIATERRITQSTISLQAMSAVVFQRRTRLTPDAVIKEVFIRSGI